MKRRTKMVLWWLLAVFGFPLALLIISSVLGVSIAWLDGEWSP